MPELGIDVIITMKRNELPMKTASGLQPDTQKDDWTILDRDGRKVGVLPNHITNSEFFNIKEMITETEKHGFDIGVAVMREYFESRLELQARQYKQVLEELKNENTRLATILESVVGEE